MYCVCVLDCVYGDCDVCEQIEYDVGVEVVSVVFVVLVDEFDCDDVGDYGGDFD